MSKFTLRGTARLSFTARIERMLVHLVYLVYLVCLVDSDWKFIRKNQTDQKDRPTRQTNPSALHEHRRPSSPPSSFYFTRNGFEFSPEAVVTVRRTRPFLPPLGTVVVMLLFVC